MSEFKYAIGQMVRVKYKDRINYTEKFDDFVGTELICQVIGQKVICQVIGQKVGESNGYIILIDPKTNKDHKSSWAIEEKDLVAYNISPNHKGSLGYFIYEKAIGLIGKRKCPYC